MPALAVPGIVPPAMIGLRPEARATSLQPIIEQAMVNFAIFNSYSSKKGTHDAGRIHSLCLGKGL
jgi:hypothetical protein